MISMSHELRIFLVGSEFFLTRGGIQFVNCLLLRALEDIGRRTPCRIECFSYGDPSGSALPGTPLAVPLRWHSFGRNRPAMAACLAGRLLAAKPHIVLFTHVNLLRLSHLVRRLAPRVRVAALGHGVEVWERLPGALRWALSRADGIAAPSCYTRDRLVGVNGVASDKTAVLPHGIDLHGWLEQGATPGGSCAGPVLLSVTRMNRADAYKGIDEALRAMPAVLRHCPGARYVVVGDGDDRLRLEQLSRDLGVAGSVEFCGELRDLELSAAYAQASLFVLPSRKEGFGIVFLEAMFHRLPVVAARAGGSVDVVVEGETGLLVPPGDPAALAAAVISLLGSPADRRQMGEAGRRRLETHFLLSHFTARWEGWLTHLAPEAVYLARQHRMFSALTPACLREEIASPATAL